MSKIKVSVEDKIYAVNLYLDWKESQHRIASMFGVSIASVQQWIHNYESMDADEFVLKGNKRYSKELKQQAISDYLSRCGSQDDICKIYGIRSKAKLQIWIKKYHSHEELKASGARGTGIMTKGRKTTFEDKGYRRIRDDLERYHGIKVNDKRVLCICRKKNTKSANNGCTRQTANPQFIAENVLNREFYTDAPNQKWLTDVTEFKYYIGQEKHKLYISAILDLYDRRIVSYVIRDNNHNALVFDTFSRAAKCINNGPMEKHK